VIAQMDTIIRDSLESGSRLGYFAALYRRVTHQIKQHIEEGKFQNGPLLESLAITFAGRYLEAYDLYVTKSGTPTAPWLVAFDAAHKRRPLVLQHLLMGMNAHINLDLAIASAVTSPGLTILSLKEDFMQVNGILASQIPVVLKLMGKCSPLIGLVTFFYKDTTEKVTHFSMDIARAYSWLLAEDLAVATEAVRAKRIEQTIGEVKGLALKLLHPDPMVRVLCFVIGLLESNDVRRNIQILSE
jgi:hypothetical protein